MNQLSNKALPEDTMQSQMQAYSQPQEAVKPQDSTNALATGVSEKEDSSKVHRRSRPGAEAQASKQANWLELKEQAILAYESGLLPRSVDSPQKAITIALMGREFNLSPMQALCGIYVVNGMTALRGSLMLRLIYERVAGAQVTVLTPPEQSNFECAVEMKRPGNKPQVFRFTLDDARKAGFLGKPIWQQHTAAMLRWAAIRTGARVVFADAIAGCYMEDELPPEAAASGTNTTAPYLTAAIPEPIVAETDRVSSFTASVGAETQHRFAPYRTAVDSRGVSDRQVNRIFAIAHSRQLARAEVGHWMQGMFGKKDPRSLTRAEYDRLCNFLLAGPAKGSHAPASTNGAVETGT